MSTIELDALYAQPKESWFRRYGKRLAGGLLCSFIVAVMMRLPYIWAAILWLCHIVTIVFGKPPGAEKIERVEQGIARTYEQGKEFAKKHHGDGLIPKILPGGGIKPTVEAVKEIKKEVDKAKAVASEVKEGAAAAKKGLDAVTETKKKVEDTAKSVGEGIRSIPEKISDLAHGRSEAKDKKDRETLEAHAKVVLGMEVDPNWTLAELRARVLKVELERKAKTGPNAQCPFCRHGMRLKRDAGGQRRCPKCSNIFGAKRALTLGPPTQQSMRLFGR